ncbi:APC amino acid permease [Fimicolochytrium jonesii]|uniref:APC amino acid permease n=1 Tax=Fimicolochytrium jonesii TaxID=1396493 RepID=UPI0022FDF62E|nr:APC amino acid permease [Fimicolochytrium jonesii]KAI8824007.1 APC amino acid permease [Fimicolochytrium jonesii]
MEKGHFDTPHASGPLTDEQRLEQLGYKQELRRELSSFTNFAFSFSIISILTGLNGLYMYGFNTGGPATIIWGWPVVSFFTLLVGLAMAEICSSFPTSGGLYYWSAQLSGPKYAPLASWVTGWFNLIGQIACTSGIIFANAAVVLQVVALNREEFVPEPYHQVLVCAAILIVHGLLNTFAVKLVNQLNYVSVWWHILGTITIVAVILALAPTHQSATYVFTTYRDATGGWGDVAGRGYVILIGLLTAQFTMTGYDASAHMTEETKNAAISGPVGIVMSIVVSFVVGWFYLIGLTFSIQNEGAVGGEDGSVGGVMQIFLDTTGTRGATLLGCVVLGAMFWCGMSSVTSNSRMIYAFTRDGALPFSSYLHIINPSTHTPVRAVWLSTVLSLVLILPILGNSTAFAAITSIATIGLYVSYAIPVFLRLTLGRHTFRKGPVHLGKWSKVVGWTAVCWTALITVLFVLPTGYPVTAQNMNYAVVMLGFVLVLSMGWWIVDARKWFKGPKIAAFAPASAPPGVVDRDATEIAL